MKANWITTNYDINDKTKYIICCNFETENKLANIGFETMPKKVSCDVGVWKIKSLKK